MGFQGAGQTFPLKFLVSLSTVGSRNLQEMPNLGIFCLLLGSHVPAPTSPLSE